jgi:hypothetical protein
MANYADRLIALLDQNPDTQISKIIEDQPDDKYPKQRYVRTKEIRDQKRTRTQIYFANNPEKYKIHLEKTRDRGRKHVICECGSSQLIVHLDRHRASYIHRRRMCWN